MKTTSCGIIILNEYYEIFLGHATGQKHFDIPKGSLEENEKPIDCAIRECLEETSIQFSKQQLQEIGLVSYNPQKNLHLFYTMIPKNSILLENLTCNSFFEHYQTKKLTPEIDAFTWVALDEIQAFTTKNMTKTIKSLNLKNLYTKKSSLNF